MRLLPHGGAAPGYIRSFDASATCLADGSLRLSWRLDADLGQLRIPLEAAPLRADYLWRHSCFEAFIGSWSSPAYREWNFSPSGAWAAYAFTGYRAGMTTLRLPSSPQARWRREAQMLELMVELHKTDISADPNPGALRIGLSAVIEAQSGTMNYWALRHPVGKPDFHHAAGFALELVTPGMGVKGGAPAP